MASPLTHLASNGQINSGASLSPTVKGLGGRLFSDLLQQDAGEENSRSQSRCVQKNVSQKTALGIPGKEASRLGRQKVPEHAEVFTCCTFTWESGVVGVFPLIQVCGKWLFTVFP